MRRGEIRYADLEPHRGSEANERRPVVIVSNDGLNGAVRTLGRGVVTVVPLTSQTLKVHPFRLGPPISRLSGALMASLDDALRLHLAL